MKREVLAPWAEPVPDVAYPFTADALLKLHEDEWLYELVDGRLVRMAPTGLEHLEVTDTLHHAMRTYVVAKRLGKVTLPDTGFRLSQPGQQDTVLAPDVGY